MIRSSASPRCPGPNGAASTPTRSCSVRSPRRSTSRRRSVGLGEHGSWHDKCGDGGFYISLPLPDDDTTPGNEHLFLLWRGDEEDHVDFTRPPDDVGTGNPWASDIRHQLQVEAPTHVGIVALDTAGHRSARQTVYLPSADGRSPARRLRLVRQKVARFVGANTVSVATFAIATSAVLVLLVRVSRRRRGG